MDAKMKAEKLMPVASVYASAAVANFALARRGTEAQALAGQENYETCRAALVDAIAAAIREEAEEGAAMVEAMRPAGGRQWTDEQAACWAALTDAATFLRNRHREK